MPTTLEQSNYTLDKFTSYPDLKPKHLEKEAKSTHGFDRLDTTLKLDTSIVPKERHLQVYKPSTTPDKDFHFRLQRS